MKAPVWVVTTLFLLLTLGGNLHAQEAISPDMRERALSAAHAVSQWLARTSQQARDWSDEKSDSYSKGRALCIKATGFLHNGGWIEKEIPRRITQALLDNINAASGDEKVEERRQRSTAALNELYRLAKPYLGDGAYIPPQDRPSFVQQAYANPGRNACGRGWGKSIPLRDAKATMSLGKELLEVLLPTHPELVGEMVLDLDERKLLPVPLEQL